MLPYGHPALLSDGNNNVEATGDQHKCTCPEDNFVWTPAHNKHMWDHMKYIEHVHEVTVYVWCMYGSCWLFNVVIVLRLHILLSVCMIIHIFMIRLAAIKTRGRSYCLHHTHWFGHLVYRYFILHVCLLYLTMWYASVIVKDSICRGIVLSLFV